MTAAPGLVEEVRTFLATEEPMPAFGSLDERIVYLVRYQARLHAAGLAVPGWPVEFGGRGLSPSAAALVASTLGSLGAPELINYTGTDVVGPALFAFADRARLERWMPPIASASELWCQLFSEPDAGSDLTGLRTKARRDGDGWRISGEKVWSTWAPYSDWGLLLARSGTQESRHRGLTTFVLKMRTPGISIQPLRTMTGSAEFASVHFDDVVLPGDALLGEVDGGWAVAKMILNAERGLYAVRRGAVVAAAMAWVLDVARRQALDVAAREAVVRAYTELRLLDLRIGGLIEDLARGVEPGPEAAVTKERMTSAEQAVAEVGNQLLGLGAVAWLGAEAPSIVEEYLYSRSASIHGGTAQIQRNVLAERVLGLPREPALA